MTQEQSNEMLAEWIERIKAFKEELEALEVGDRLETASSIARLHNAIAQSLHGWAQWLKNPGVMNQLSKEELAETFTIFKKLALEFIDLDFRMSSSVLKKQKSKKKKTKKTEKEKGYIS